MYSNGQLCSLSNCFNIFCTAFLLPSISSMSLPSFQLSFLVDEGPCGRTASAEYSPSSLSLLSSPSVSKIISIGTEPKRLQTNMKTIIFFENDVGDGDDDKDNHLNKETMTMMTLAMTMPMSMATAMTMTMMTVMF